MTWLSSIIASLFAAIANAVSGFFQARQAVSDNGPVGQKAHGAFNLTALSRNGL